MLRYGEDARYSLTVTILRGHVKGGVIVVDEPTGLPEGTAVELVLLTDEDELSADERAALEASIDRGLDQSARGEGDPAHEVLRRLRAH